MGTDAAVVEEKSLNLSGIKVHVVMCAQVLELVDEISKLALDIEAAQPRCSEGIQALCLLQSALEKARLLVKSCCESSKLYLAITADAMLKRCEKARNLFEESLCQLQNMVPVALELQISQVINGLKCVVFVVDSPEEEAGKALRALVQRESGSDSVKGADIETFQFVAPRLNLVTPKDLLIEKRSIRKQLDKVLDNDQSRKKILMYLLYLVKKYEKLVMGEHTEYPSVLQNGSFSVTTESQLHANPRLKDAHDQALQNTLHVPMPPEEFRCPISSKLMHDPVVIASGRTFERMCIQNWFDEGHDTCPKTGIKLAHLYVMPNTAMRDLILKWCVEYKVNNCDPSLQTSVLDSLETSSYSITSSQSSLQGLRLQMDLSSMSLGSLDTSYGSNFSHAKSQGSSDLLGAQNDNTSQMFQFFPSVHDIERDLLSNLCTLRWESRCMAIDDVKHYFKCYNVDCVDISYDNLWKPLIKFLKDSIEKNDVKAQKAGAQLFLQCLSACRGQITCVSEDAFVLLVSLLDTEATEEALAIMELLSSMEKCGSKLAACGALTTILRILDEQNREFQEAIIQILCNWSSVVDVRSEYVPLECIPKLVPFLSDSSLACRCVMILKNLCAKEAVRISVAETKGCIASIAELLENGSCEEQEHAASILLSLCSERMDYCRLAMDEGIIPALVTVSVNGNDRGKVIASELLRLLREIDYEEPNSTAFDGFVSNNHYEPSEKKSSTKMTGFFRRKITLFSKLGSVSSGKN